MGKLETNDWININNIIYVIYTMKNTEEMQRKFLERLRSVIEYDAADFCLASKDKTDAIDSAVAIGIDHKTAVAYDDIDYSRDIMYSGRSLVYRESDIMSEEKRVHTDYYRNVYKANGFHFSIQMVLGVEGRFLGVVTLYRKIGKEDFDYYDIFALDILKDHMSFSLNQRLGSSVDVGSDSDVHAFAKRYILTKRETEVLLHMLTREDNYTISDRLAISMNTLKKHERNIYQKCGVSSRMQLFKLIASES